MNRSIFHGHLQEGGRVAQSLVLFLTLLLILESLTISNVPAQERQKHRRDSLEKAPQELTDQKLIAHVLARLSFGARPGDFERVKAFGVNAYIEQQLNPDTIDDTAVEAKLAKLPSLSLATPLLLEAYNPPKPVPLPVASPLPKAGASITATADVRSPSAVVTATGKADAQKPAAQESRKPADIAKAVSKALPASMKPQPPVRNPQMVITELQRAAFLRAVYSERQLNEMMVEFWENHFSIFAQKDADRFLLTSFDRDAIRPFTLGRFRDLLGAVAHSPAMLFYLDNWQSSVLRQYPAANGKPARQSGGNNENYARELMELHTLGVGGGYTQKDVQEVARCFTGWTIRKSNQEGLFVFNPTQHDNGEKMVLGHRIPAGGGIADGERVLDILASHPSTARFIATKLARRFTSDEPPSSLINRAAKVFLDTDGSLRETLRAIITSPEFFASNAYRAKVRTPFEYAAAATRALAAETDGDRPVLDWIARMGQPIFGRLTPDGYSDTAQQWLSTGALLSRFNFASALAANRIKGTQINPSRFLPDVDLNDPQAVATKLTQLILSGDITSNTKEALGKFATEAPINIEQAKLPSSVAANSTSGYMQRASTSPLKSSKPIPDYLSQLLTLLIGAPEFQRR